MSDNNFLTLKKQVKDNEIAQFYIFHGVEDYMKNFYIKKIQDAIIDENFASFNLEKFDEQNFEINAFLDAVESMPAMAERKMIVVRDVDVFKLKSSDKSLFEDILADLPDYVCVIFDYATIEFKMDKRMKIGSLILKHGHVIEFENLSQNELDKFILRIFKQAEISIATDVMKYLTFITGMGMSNLVTECEKLCAFCEETVTKEDVDKVCSKVLEAKIFDVTDKIISKDINRARELISDLIMLKTDVFSILSVINSQFQRLYAIKLGQKEHKDEKYIMNLVGLHSAYAMKISSSQASKLDLVYLRNACNLCVKATFDIVSINSSQEQLLDILVVKLGALYD